MSGNILQRNPMFTYAIMAVLVLLIILVIYMYLTSGPEEPVSGFLGTSKKIRSEGMTAAYLPDSRSDRESMSGRQIIHKYNLNTVPAETMMAGRKTKAGLAAYGLATSPELMTPGASASKVLHQYGYPSSGMEGMMPPKHLGVLETMNANAMAKAALSSKGYPTTGIDAMENPMPYSTEHALYRSLHSSAGVADLL